ncbi:3-dehydroquinate synthase [Fusobacterium necrophorum]|uniref:3-dehydroquinate synthase n=1 Tax=Fusobacterium necrophorum TaxID=859 RepID=UPI00088DDA05|nr:3-dehydroquinate synthase [Fusobacterium necrophorum]AYZ74230.1 3-dehydroquinate synthase [Fusobacterium necrophorum]AZW09888.1 3-dehydroquinate synthase [Fusobacterium necrophorum subsp. necrophorum]SDB02605.1 3-dehydroquinate synthase [Fusobacterium necrophorum]SQD08619.1 3-dehydroquinate synthase [Fusobacterium necrophorum subsp. necrophorum]
MSESYSLLNLEYNVCFGVDIKEKIQSFIDSSNYSKVVFITDKTVDLLYPKHTFFLKGDYHRYVIESGELSKNINTYYKIIRFLSSINVDRHSLIVTFGGGMVGDLGGFVASTYMRGVDYIQIPTTLLSMVDASIGSKTAINTEDGKNLIGTFYNPRGVFIDFKFLKTLPEKEFRNGIAEIIKSAIIKDRELFDLIISKNIYEEGMMDIIIRSINIKKKVVENDFKELSERQLLNFGHTIGHAIEKISDFSIPHGYAISTGMAMISKAYCRLGYISEETYLQIVNALKKYQLPISCEYTKNQIYQEVLKDKKNSGDKINLIYPKKIGCAVIDSISRKKLENIISIACE